MKAECLWEFMSQHFLCYRLKKTFSALFSSSPPYFSIFPLKIGVTLIFSFLVWKWKRRKESNVRVANLSTLKFSIELEFSWSLLFKSTFCVLQSESFHDFLSTRREVCASNFKTKNKNSILIKIRSLKTSLKHFLC